MFWDLNVVADDNGGIRHDRIAAAVKNGYDGLAINTLFEGKVTDKSSLNSRLKSTKSECDKITQPSGPLLPQGLMTSQNEPRFQLIHRVTVVVHNASDLSSVNSANKALKKYHIIALKPTDKLTFSKCCQHHYVDIISFDLGSKLPFLLLRRSIEAAMKKGAFLEIQYSGYWKDEASRQLFIGNARTLVTMTRGKNLIISSESSRANQQTAPHNVYSIAYVLGLSAEQAKAAISVNCQKLAERAEQRKLYYRGVVSVKRKGKEKQQDKEGAGREAAVLRTSLNGPASTKDMAGVSADPVLDNPFQTPQSWG